ncbi:MAG TPA: hypothetical protein IGS53_07905 [Leptolyngbyaceae cyanobacterium M33_DOE_097]|uniref:Uncharacterized protein n=1 Tax=Oscillatoriales cyanobacterium SpSt-418 TaxID=2282169 RepID=A0A7C3KG51_9CYAN|nr:hypothetical protein [Leptolyngbyaceae cyanobacterium M33_DOE_097]
MVSAQELENLQAWLRQHSSGYLLLSRHGEFITTEAIQQLAESCDELEVEDRRVYLNWTNRTASPVGSAFESIVAIPDAINSRIQLKPTPLTFEEYIERSPGGLELSSGYLGSSIESAFNLLDISLETFGLLQVVRRAPRELWEEAIDQVYGAKAGAQ